jgi:ABC-type polysaccharide/polyol phosphate transport system ATPase subunit
MTASLRFERVSKAYHREEGYRSVREDFARLLGRGSERARRGPVLALRDVSFEVPAGQSLAIIGDNGAGKSTALKIASRITYPSAGRVSVRGRVGALIEVGSGLHPELSGRENVDLYGRILGLSRRDVRARFDQIVEFAGIPQAIDQPVKQYSSGMQLRLGFAIAAHLEPDVLIVDEAIAVGDAAFQYRCVERMSALVREGRTLVFVSHNLMAVEALCERTILLSGGTVAADGDSRDIVHEYLRRVQTMLLEQTDTHELVGEGIEIRDVTLLDARGRRVSTIDTGDDLTVRVEYNASRKIVSPVFSIGLADPALGMLAVATMLIDGQGPDSIEGPGVFECSFEGLPFKPRTYDVLGEVREGFGRLLGWRRWTRFRMDGEIPDTDGRNVVTRSLKFAPISVPYHWNFPDPSDEQLLEAGAGRR